MTSGTRSARSLRRPAQEGRALPPANAAIAARLDLRGQRLCHDAGTHAEEGPPLPVLCHDQRAEARPGNVLRATAAGQRDRGCRHRSGSRPAAGTRDDRKDWAAAREDGDDTSETEVRDALMQFDALCPPIFKSNDAAHTLSCRWTCRLSRHCGTSGAALRSPLLWRCRP